MENKYILSCESTVDMPYSYISGRNIPVLFYSYQIDGESFADDMMRDPEALPAFYKRLDGGALPSTSQLNEFDYTEFLDGLLQQGDVLHIAFGSGMTNSVANARRAAETLREKYPERKLIVIDSTCSCGGYGLLVDAAADLRDAGKSMEEVAAWTEANCHYVQHQFFSTSLKFFKRSGRVSGPTAAIGTVLGICPIMHLDYAGRIKSYSKTRGKKSAIEYTVNEIEKNAAGGKDYDGRCYICHSHCLEDALQTQELLEKRFVNLRGKIRIFNIGTIVASHCGPGTVAVFFMGKERQKED